VNSPQHGPDLFLASLATDARGLEGARHFLFVRGWDEYYEIDPQLVTITEGDSPYTPVVDDFRRAAAVSSAPPARATGSGFAAAVLGLLQLCWRYLIDQLRRVMHMTTGQSTGSAPPAAPPPAAAPAPMPAWTRTEAGKAAGQGFGVDEGRAQ
jgi:hypothetical protein